MDRKEFDQLEAGDVLTYFGGLMPCNVEVFCGYWRNGIREQLWGDGLYLVYDQCDESKIGIEHVLDEDLRFYKKCTRNSTG